MIPGERWIICFSTQKRGKTEEVVGILQSKAGVRLLDVLECPHNIILMMQARERHRLAELTVEALASVEEVTEDLQLLPTSNGYGTSLLTKPVDIRRNRRVRPTKHSKKK